MAEPTTPLPDDPAGAIDERTMLIEFLDFYRDVFVRKLEGLDDEQGRTASCPPSDLSPMGLGRHMAEVERQWMQDRLTQGGVPALFDFSVDPDAELHPGCEDTMAETIAMWRAQVATARSNVASFGLDDALYGGGSRGPTSIRWMLIHMIEEYARHVGHLDLLCEAIDGRTGD